MFRRSLELRMLIALLIVFSLGFCSLVLYLYDSRDELRRTTMFIQAREITAGFTADSDPASLPTHFAGGELSYTLYSPKGEYVWKSENLEQPRRLRLLTLQDEYRLFRKPLRSGFVINVPVLLHDGSVLMVAKRDDFERETIGALLTTRMFRGMVIQLLFCLVAVTLIVGLLHWMMRPIRQAARLTDKFGPAHPDYRIPLHKLPREILPLAQAANSGMDRMSHAYTLEKRFFEDAAHELRTPLTVLDLRLQKARLGGQTDWLAVTRDMSQIRRLLGQLLTLSRHEYEMPPGAEHIESVNVSRAAREAAAVIIPLFETARRELSVEIEDHVFVHGNANLLHETLINVMENALLHGAGTVTLRVFTKPEAGSIIEIVDEGTGVDLQTQNHMFMRFRKNVQSTTGSGLGLAIARRHILNMGATIAFISQSPCIVRMVFYSSGSDQPIRA